MSRKSRREILLEGYGPTDWESIVRECIRAYFSDKKWFVGGPIPSSELYSDWSIQTVLRTPFDDKWEEVVHGHCLPNTKNPKVDCGNLDIQVYKLLLLLKDMGQKWIPKDFHPGLVLLHFKLCKGMSIPLFFGTRSL